MMREETRLLRQFLRDKAIEGGMAEYTAIDDAVGWTHGTSQNKRRGVLSSALAWLEKEHGYFADCVTGQGYKFLRGNTAIVTAEQLRMRRLVAQTQKLSDTVDNCAIDATPEKILVVRTKLNFLEWAFDSRTQKTLEDAAHKTKEEIRLQGYREKREELLKKLSAAID